MSTFRPGPRNLITDVEGLLVGNAEDPDARTGVTVIVCDDHWRAAVDVRGGGPGVRETETLAAENLMGRAHAVVLSGGSVFGLAAADAVCWALSGRGVGVRIREGSPPVPIVPAAVLFDLVNGGCKEWGREPPYRALGADALEAAAGAFQLGRAGAGFGAQAGRGPGGLGSASLDLGEGLVVGALVAVNPVGSVFMPDGSTFWAWPFEVEGEFGGRRPSGEAGAIDPLPDLGRLVDAGRMAAGAATTLGCVATNADLSTAETKRLAMMAQDGLARAVRPAHTPFDGDTVFALASGKASLGTGDARSNRLAALGSAAADCVARAIARGVYEALRAEADLSGEAHDR